MFELQFETVKGYELREQIGVGGYGTVFRAYQPLVERDVAIKIIHPSFVNHPDFIRRFEAEAQLVARLEHPHIVPLYDYWRDADGAFLVMRWLRAGSLKGRLASAALPLDEIVRLLEQIGPALTVAHRRGVIHRDIKPDNILLDEDGNAYLADFGIAKNLGGTSATQTKAQVLGSPEYLSPEQIEHGPIRPQTDIYGLGILLYEALTGQVPFPGLELLPLLYKHVHEPIPSVRELRPDLPAALDTVIQRATAKRAADRHTDVLSLVRDFRRAVSWRRAVQLAEREIAERGGDSQRATGAARPSYATLQLNDPALLDVAPPPVENPYKGLRAFQEADSADFFGREALAARLVARMQERDPAARFLAVVGPSGSGKSSVVRAGLIPALRKEALPGAHRWYIVEMFPGAHPVAELASALLRVAVNPPDDLEAQLARDADGLRRVLGQVLPGGSHNELLLVIDQFEEVWTRVSDEAERAHLLAILNAALRDPHSRLRIVVTLRADFYDRPLLYGGFSDLMRRRTEVIVPLSNDELRDAIVCPAERIGLAIEPELVAAITRDVDVQPAMLPLLQYALTEVFGARTTQGLTLAAYRAAGGVAGALARRAEELYTTLDAPQREATQQLFLRLVTPGEGAEDTRRRVRQSELAAVAGDLRTLETVLERYGGYRLLTLDREPTTREPTVEVAHEALIRSWERLRQWLDASRDDLRLQRRLEAAAHEWRGAGQDPGFLATGSRLSQFEEWLQTTSVALNDAEQAYLDASRSASAAAAEREARRAAHEAQIERRSKNVLRLFAVVGTVAALLALALSGGLYTSMLRADALAADLQVKNQDISLARDNAKTEAARANALARQADDKAQEAEGARAQAEQAATRAQGLALVNEAQSLLERGQIDRARALIVAGSRSRLASPEMESVLSQIGFLPGTVHILKGHEKTVNAVAFSPDGKRALSASTDWSVKLWDLTTGTLLATLLYQVDTEHHAVHLGHTNGVNAVTFSPDGNYALAGDTDATMLLWDLTTGAVVQSFKHHSKKINAVAFSPDGQTLLSASDDGSVIVWDRGTGEQRLTFTGHTQEVKTALFSPDGTQIASGSGDQLVKLWSATTGAEIKTFAGHSEKVASVVFSSDGKYLLSGGDDQRVILWDIATGAIQREFIGHETAVFAVAISPNGRRVAAVGMDNLIRIWSVDSGQLERNELTGHGGGISSIAWSRDGQQVITGARDSTVRVWAVEHGARERCFGIASPCDSGGERVAFSPNGKYALTALGSPSNVARLWDVATGTLVRSLAYQNGGIMRAIFSPDGTRIATASQDGTVVVQDTLTGDHLMVLAGHAPDEEVHGVAFSPDGAQLLTAADDKTLILWDLATGTKIGEPFRGHNSAVRVVAFTPDGRYAISGARDHKLMLWRIADHHLVRTFSGHSGNVLDLAISPDNSHFLSGSDDSTLILWTIDSDKPFKVFDNHSGGVRGVAYSADGTRFVSASDDRSMIVWDATTNRPIRVFAGLPGKVLDAKLSLDMRSVLAVTSDASTHLWRIESGTEMLAWVSAHRYIPELSCELQARYDLERSPSCAEVAAAP